MTTRTAIITGAGNGIGRGTALHLIGEGWRVAGLDTDKEALEEIAAPLPDGQFLGVPCDVGSEGAVAKAFATIADWADCAALLANNAGIADPYSGPLEDLALDSWQAWIDASLTSAFLCSRAALPLLRAYADEKGEAAAIVNITSTRAIQSEPDCFGYAAAKGGLAALTHAMAISLGPQIRVNAVAPGWIETGPWQKQADRSAPAHSQDAREQHPVGRVGEVRDIAETIAWLASPAAGFITGQQLAVDGGMTRKMIYTA